MNSKKLLCILLLVSLNISSFAKTVFTYYNNRKPTQSNESYGFMILKLSLEKTKKEYGNYELVSTPSMNGKRAMLTLKNNSLENLILKSSVTKEILSQFSCIKFPIDRGVVGYRVAFVSPKIEKNINEYDSLDKLKYLNIAQGKGWLDTKILKYNGFKVNTFSHKDSIFNMLSLNRVDLFFRGINEILDESILFNNLKEITYNKSFVLYYPLPRFFCTNKLNQMAIERIEKGLKMAYTDGSLDRLFIKYYQKSIDLLNIKERKVYTLTNPFLKDIDTSYEKYLYDPFKKKMQ